MKTKMACLLAVLLTVVLSGCSEADKAACYNWPQGKSPAEIGQKVALEVLSHPFGNSYQGSCSYYGVLIFSDITKNVELRNKIIDAYSQFRAEGHGPIKGHVDGNVFGITGFEIYRQTKDPKYLKTAKDLADDEWLKPRADGLSHYTRFWVDDIYMVCSLQMQAYKNLKDPIYADRAALQVEAYINKLQQDNGLFYHTDKVHYFWSRGNGWAAAGMTEVLLALPEDHPKRAFIMKAYQKMMAGLLKYQNESGVWHQLIDNPESFLETSSTGMFVFALSNGVAQGWLPEKVYKDVAIKGWLGLMNYFDEDKWLRQVCIGTGAIDELEWYLNRPQVHSNFHGHAALLWAATGMLRMQ